MNPLLASFLAGLLRQALAGVAVYFVAHGYFTESEIANYVSAAIAAIISVAWMAWVKYGERLKFLTAAGSSVPMSEATIEQKVKDGAAPPVSTPKTVTPQTLVTLVLAVGLSFSITACASARGPLVTADRTIHASLAAVQDTANTLCDAHVIQPEPCKQFSGDLVMALQAGDDFNRAVRAERVGNLAQLLQAIGKLTADINTLIPEQYRAKLLALLGQAVNLGFEGAQ